MIHRTSRNTAANRQTVAICPLRMSHSQSCCHQCSPTTFSTTMAVEFTTEELSEVFDKVDTDKDGKLNRKEIAELLRILKIEPTRLEIDLIFSEIDTDNSGLICKSEFFKFMKSPPAGHTTMGELVRQFRNFDCDSDGIISLPELEEILMETANLKDRAVIKTMFEAADTNNDGRITFQEFVEMMKE